MSSTRLFIAGSSQGQSTATPSPVFARIEGDFVIGILEGKAASALKESATVEVTA